MVEIWGKYQGCEWELIDECKRSELSYTLGEYQLAFGAGWSWKTKKIKA